MATNLLKRFRLLPAVLAVGGTLLVMKSAGLALDARAQDAAPGQSAPAAQTTAAPTAAPSNDPVAEDPDSTSAQVDVLTSLAKRRTELDARERDLEMRENLITAAEKRVDGKIDDLKQLQTEIQALLVQHDAAEQKQIDSLVKTYSSMKPRDAARIFNNLNDDVLLEVAGQMKPDVLGAILSQMLPDAAQKLTVKLAGRLKLPETPAQTAAAQPVPAQLASANPASATAPSPAEAPPPAQPAPLPAAGSPAPDASAAADKTAGGAPASTPPPANAK
jgi:flagellar motility protein MotE (MotC chaperone)